MEKRAIRSIALFMFLLVFSVSFVDCASGQGDAGGGFVTIIESPVEGKVINGNSVNLTFSVASAGQHTTVLGDLFWVKSIFYNVSLDGEFYYQNRQNEISGWLSTTSIRDEHLNFTNLTQGEHTIKVDIVLNYYISILLPDLFYYMSASVDFLVRGIQPQVAVSGLDVYQTNQPNQPTFNVTTNEPYATVSYSLDGAANVTLPQNWSVPFQDLYVYNITLFGLPEGAHTLKAYAKDAFNQTAMAEKTFTIPIPLSTIAVTVGIAIVVCAAFLLLLKKRAKSSNLKSFKRSASNVSS